LELPQMDAAVHHFLASLPPPALDPKLLSHATENHLRIFQGRPASVPATPPSEQLSPFGDRPQ
jgi:hypothetical protein